MQGQTSFNLDIVASQRGATIDRDERPEFLARAADIDAERSAFDIVARDLEPGDAIGFDYRRPHGTGDDTTRCERPGETSPPYREHGMRQGDGPRTDRFPVPWRRAPNAAGR